LVAEAGEVVGGGDLEVIHAGGAYVAEK
jgi:hypothetical protein